MKDSLKSEISHVWLYAQLCQSLCNPMDCSPRGSSVHGNLFPGKDTGVGCNFLLELLPSNCGGGEDS